MITLATTGSQGPLIKTLMVIDDSTFDQLICKRVAASTGLVSNLLQYTAPEEALEYLSDPGTLKPDLILLDINMPRMDGFEFLQAAQDRIGANLCPIIVMLDTSIHPKSKERAQGFASVWGFLGKPLDKGELHRFANMLQTSR